MYLTATRPNFGLYCYLNCMDEYNSGWDPEVKNFFRKILASFGAGLLWMMLMATVGLYFGLALIGDIVHWYNMLFYVIFLLSLVGLIRYLYKVWRK